jgi:hypothetical protein
MVEHEYPLPGKFSELEEAILIWLYGHPGQDASTHTFTKLFNPGIEHRRAEPRIKEGFGRYAMCDRDVGGAGPCYWGEVSQRNGDVLEANPDQERRGRGDHGETSANKVHLLDSSARP